MKKLIIAAAILLVTTASSFALGIHIKLKFGHGSGCSQRGGICTIDADASLLNTATINPNTGDLEITFTKNASQNAELQSQFANGIFNVPVAYKLSADLCAQLGVASFTVKAGNYAVVETNTQYSIKFKK